MKARAEFTKYPHHDREVWVRTDLIGFHRMYCLCYRCSKFHPGDPANCLFAQKLYEFCVLAGMTTPVWECPYFDEKWKEEEGDK